MKCSFIVETSSFHNFTNGGSVSIFEIQVQWKYTLAKFIGRFGKSIPGGSPDVRD